jgi:hypothetical protein
LSLVNGKETSDHPAVILIGREANADQVAFCTATFVSDTTALTSSHCLDDSANGGAIYLPGAEPDKRALLIRGVRALKAFHFGFTSVSAEGVTTGADAPRLDDLAVLTFPPGTAPAVVALSERQPTAGEVVTLVGYGSTHYVDVYLKASASPPAFVTRRRVGTSVVVAPPAHPAFSPEQIYFGFNTASESEVADGTAVLTSKGDSGGPLFLGGKIVGIASKAAATVENPPRYFGSHNSLTSAKAGELLEIARAGGADIPPPGVLVSLPEKRKEQAGGAAGAASGGDGEPVSNTGTKDVAEEKCE